MAREVLYQGLLEIPVLYQDNSKDSLGYFRIGQLPSEFTAGKNLFTFKCNPVTFLDNSPLYVEVLDSAGYPIYTEVNINAENDDQYAVVSVYVDESTAPGPGTIILCGIIDQDTSGNLVNTNNGINIRWNNPIQIYPSKRNTSEIVYATLPSVSVTSSLQSYVDYFYPGNGNRFTSSLHTELNYLLYNNTAVLTTSSLSIPFRPDIVSGTIYISSSDISKLVPNISTESTILSESIASFINSGSIALASPLIIKQSNSNVYNEFKSATVNAKIVYEQTPYSSSLRDKRYNLVTANFTNLEPLSGTVSRIKSYYKQKSVGKYILFNETDITQFESGYGYTTSSISLQLPLHGLEVGDNTDFKFEFINPDGTPSNQVVIAKNYTTYPATMSFALTASSADVFYVRDYIDFNTAATVTQPVAGRLSWNNTDGTLDLGLKGGNVTLQVGQENVIRIVNKTGADLLESDFRAVRVRSVSEGGAQGQRLAVKFAQADSDADSATTLGIVTENIANNQEGFITIFGEVRGINTTGAKSYGGLETWVDGDMLYLSPFYPGYLTKVKPTAPNHLVIVGYVTYAHQNNGKIFVKIDNGWEIGELHDVLDLTTTASYGDLLMKSASVWINTTQLTGSYGITGSFSTNGTVKLTGLINQITPKNHVVTFDNSTGQLFITASSAFGGGGSGGGSTPGGSNTTVQFNNGGVLDGSTSFTYDGSTVRITGSLIVTQSNFIVRGTAQFTGSVNAVNGFSGSLFGTASQSISSSYAYTASSAISASFAYTASRAISSSYAYTASSAISSSYSYTASSAVSSSYSYTASSAISSSYAIFAGNVISSSYSYTASSAISSSYAYTASSAISASWTVTAGSSLSASFATSASIAIQSNTASFLTPLVQPTVSITGSSTAASLQIRTVSASVDVHGTAASQIVVRRSTSINASSVWRYLGSRGAEIGTVSGDPFSILANNRSLAVFSDTGIITLRPFTQFLLATGSFNYIYTTSSTANVNIGAAVDLGARLGVRGSGTTSATTAFRVENSSATASLVVKDDGYVGIGTTTPSVSLAVYSGSSGLTFNPNSATISSTGTDIKLFANGQNVFRGLDNWTGTWTDAAVTSYFQVGRNSGNTAFSAYVGTPFNRVAFITSRFQITNTGASNTPPVNYFQIDVNNTSLFTVANTGTVGRVGINNISPSHSLDVSGSVRISNALLVSSSINVTGSVIVTGSYYQSGLTQEFVSVTVGGLATNATVVSKPIATATTMIFEYRALDIISGTDQRSGIITANFNSLGQTFNESVTADIGSTGMISFNVSGPSPYQIVVNNGSVNPYEIKGILRYF